MGKIVNHEMVVLARESRGLTQGQLAELLKLEQYEVSRLENGLLPHAVVGELLPTLSKVLRYPETFFYQEEPIYAAGMNFYRKHKGLPARDLKQVLALMNIYRMSIERLLASVDFDDVLPLKEFKVDEYGSPEEAARAIRQYLRLPRGRVDNMTKILERLGIVVVPYKFGNRKFSGVSLIMDAYTLVFLNEMPPDRWRFTLAHELGHIVMHNSPPKPDDPIEEEADRFASEFLMPEADIYPYLTNLGIDSLANLKLHWRVAMSALLKRANTLGTITDRQYRTMWQKMSKYRLSEPKELDPPVEKPALLQEIVDFHLKDLRFTPETLSHIFCLEPEEFNLHFTQPKRHLRLVS